MGLLACAAPSGSLSGPTGSTSGSSGPAPDAGGIACRATSDCADPETTCTKGRCLIAVCADGGPFDVPCDSSSAADGTCLPAESGSATLGACVQGGSSDGGCDPTGSRENPTGLCARGLRCLPSSSGGRCTPACTIDDAESACGENAICLPPGGCVPLGPGGCLEASAREDTELAACVSSAQCDCPESCQTAASGGALCERPCASSSDCLNPATACSGGFCTPVTCAVGSAGQTLAGAFGEPCVFSADAGAGICVPFPSVLPSSSGLPAFAYGLCLATGSDPIGEACDPAAGRSLPALLCVPGSICASEVAQTGPLCEALCTADGPPRLPSDAGGCVNGGGCFALFRGVNPILAPGVGVCEQCSQLAATCYASAECCSGFCVDAGRGRTCQ